MTKSAKPELVHVGENCLWYGQVVRVHSTYSDQTCDVITEQGNFVSDIEQDTLRVIV